ncbi:hypothetical protein O6H91_04G113500 [Diphasiastrum complanatum]|uniref:Uncharacterized protein n=2 Tax=Diphasiastrum complanatum TaxID=34168 RepID=A0ACC2E0N6_DIPCM|nr:hypothetical protein O6H91_04G113500 [Diphasiastrum complanatum]KAJ7560101.1 hypothetical protein O6H91_04G113500 [Diphasiastrum complanatum]
MSTLELCRQKRFCQTYRNSLNRPIILPNSRCRQEMLEKFRKERNVHRMHHQRIAQEKNKLIVDIKRLRRHFAQYEPIIRELKKRYEVAVRQKALLTLERDKLQAQISAVGFPDQNSEMSCSSAISKLDCSRAGIPLNRKEERIGQSSDQTVQPIVKVDPLSAVRSDPFPDEQAEPVAVKDFTLQKTFRGHMMPISNIIIHPKKPVVVTASDDATWQMWGLPTGDLIMTGGGHKDWVSGIDFHPSGMQLVSSSGDCTVKIWSFEKARCVHTFFDHTQAVWAVAYHDTGDVLVSASLDHTARIWDLSSMKCRGTLRGHVDSVNGVVWQSNSNILCTVSSDKTVSLWDARSSICAQTFYGHQSSCNHAAFDPKGITVASVDANGIAKLWDIRKVAEYFTINVGPHSANKCAIDKSGHVIAIASSDRSIKCFNIHDEVVPIKELHGHQDAVHAVAFDNKGKFLVSSGSDCTFRIWA